MNIHLELKPIRLKTPGMKGIRICMPELMPNGISFYCLGFLGSFFAASSFSSVKAVFGKWIAIKYLNRLKSRKAFGGKPDIILYCSYIKSINHRKHKLLGLESLELRILSRDKEEYIIGQADLSRGYRDTIIAIENHLRKVCRLEGCDREKNLIKDKRSL